MKWSWDFNAGNILSAVAILVAFYYARRTDKRSFFEAHNESIRTMQDIVTKVNMMYEWFVRTVINKKAD